MFCFSQYDVISDASIHLFIGLHFARVGLSLISICFTSFRPSIYNPYMSVGVRKLQVAMIARSSGEMSLFVSSDSTSCHEFASQLGLAFFYMRKTLKTSEKPGRQCQWLFQCDQLLSPAERAVTVGWHRPIE